MRYLYKMASIFLPVALLALAGCGGSSGTTAADPFVRTTPGSNVGTTNPPITAQDPAFGLLLTTDLTKPTDLTVLPQIDVNNGTVLLTAQLTNTSGGVYIDPLTHQQVAAGAPVPNQSVTFQRIAGPATCSIDYFTPVTDKNGVAKAILTTGDVPYTTDVIIEATTTVDGNIYRAYTAFQIVRGVGVIMFSSSAGTMPGGQTNVLPLVSSEVDPTLKGNWYYNQLIPFKLTDSNGNPRVGVPVTISVYSISTNRPGDVTVDFLVPPVTETSQQTITTDSAGQGIFNSTIYVATPEAGASTTVAIVFKAVTNDPKPVTAYLGASYSLKGKETTTP